ncbi:Calcium-activated potassium channel subunit alpha-1 [Phytophthora boehmeriae]|uniref:Calcium-activated potassium channel subunit alpha-1 n=1 Tax=Phytophthora boehmeriae TaxID=109152 RepID=A0A8T1X6Y3_9STRA|nr:Calcium-activated potassium channel subunit alpha-1 [Phytophthora boehmeriae]
MADVALVDAISPACSITDDSAGCYTASWYLIWDQVRYWLLIQVPVVAVSIVYEWLELSSYRYVERLRKICDSPLTNVVNYVVQLVTSIYVCINWIVRGGSLSVSFSSWSIESLFLIATGVGYGIRWLAAKNKVNFVLKLHNLFDLLSVVAHFTISFQTLLIGNKYYRSWLDFGFLRAYVGYVVVHLLFTRYPNKTFFSQVLFVVFKALCLVFFFAAVLFSLEQLGELPHTNSFLLHVYKCTSEDGMQSILRATSDGTTEYPTCDETWSFFSSIYFMFVTVSTVGYGDFSPHTVLGQLTVCVIIVFGIYTFANESAAFMTLYGDQRGTLVKYDGSRNTVHVIVTGNPSVPQTKDFIREFFHPDHEEAFQGDDDSDSEDDTEVSRTVADQNSPGASRSRDAPMMNYSQYGSIHEAYSAMEKGEVSDKKDHNTRNSKPLVSKWMHRGGSLIRETHIVILMQFDKAGAHASYQREIKEFVEQNSRYHKRVFLVYGSPLRDTDLKNAQLDRAMAVFFLPNKYSNDGNKEDAATVLRVLSVSQQKREHTQLFAMLANSDNRTLLEATGLSKENLVCADEIRLGLMGLSCRCPGLSTVVSNLITSRSGELPPVDPEQAHLIQPWVLEYIGGAANEIYSCCLAKHFHGMNFTQATMQIHRQSNGLVLLIAVEADGDISFNPGRWYRITPSTKAYMIAESIGSLEPFAGTLTMSSVAALSSNMALLQSRGNLLSRARQAQHNVERRIPKHVQEYILRCAAADDLTQLPTAPTRQLIASGGHIVVCSNIGNESGGQRSMSRLVNFLRPLRAPHIERIVPVVIVDAGTFDTVSWLQLKDFGEVYHVHGSPQSHHVLAEAGIYTASSIVVLAQGNESGYDDSKAIFNAILVNSALQHNRIFTIIELRDVHNNRFLDPVASFGSSRRIQTGNFIPDEYDIKSGLASCRSVQSSAPRESIQHSRASMVTRKRTWIQRKGTVVMNSLSAIQTFFLGSLKTAAQQVSTYGADSDSAGPTIESLYNGDDNDTFFQERFMNGALFPSYVADDLLIQSFFNPSLNMFIRKILDGKSCFVLYDVPKELRRHKLNYGELFEYMTSGVAHTLPIGLLRAKGGPGGAPYPYVYTCPSSDAVIYPGDKIFVLINVMALNRLADKLQQRFRNRGKVPMTLADLVDTLAKPPKAM